MTMDTTIYILKCKPCSEPSNHNWMILSAHKTESAAIEERDRTNAPAYEIAEEDPGFDQWYEYEIEPVTLKD